jgi:spore coat polysaccharide biosynthesis predicted glycosyltransferase SpsG
VVVDDPSERHAGGWIAACRRGGIPVASLHDLGLGADGADLIVDGSIGARRRRWQGPRQLVGPQYCIVSPDLVGRRGVRGARSAASSVLIALGGGPRTGVALRLGRALTERAADLRVIVAGGFVAEKPASLHARLEWLASPVQLQSAMQEATVVVAGGGLTLYECCAAGTPAVAVSVVPAQRPAVAGFARAGAALDAGALPVTRQRLDEVARLTCELVSDAVARHRLVARGRKVVDGKGLERVCRALRQLLGERRRRSRAMPARGGASR